MMKRRSTRHPYELSFCLILEMGATRYKKLEVSRPEGVTRKWIKCAQAAQFHLGKRHVAITSREHTNFGPLLTPKTTSTNIRHHFSTDSSLFLYHTHRTSSPHHTHRIHSQLDTLIIIDARFSYHSQQNETLKEDNHFPLFYTFNIFISRHLITKTILFTPLLSLLTRNHPTTFSFFVSNSSTPTDLSFSSHTTLNSPIPSHITLNQQKTETNSCSPHNKNHSPLLQPVIPPTELIPSTITRNTKPPPLAQLHLRTPTHNSYIHSPLPCFSGFFHDLYHFLLQNSSTPRPLYNHKTTFQLKKNRKFIHYLHHHHTNSSQHSK
ncbi:uncharacterized protein LOC111240821 [Vigna radiata var. radiata]|uniref:Uncharacterized protein LOC111240821 n=1 Tax=Vigna radiata var. radiata TaxID=3916 RepID=A0A3Q0EK67_VIGRR|nr:uncharacterized protein LOC111240821 [Vigna radiata var. radiata]